MSVTIQSKTCQLLLYFLRHWRLKYTKQSFYHPSCMADILAGRRSGKRSLGRRRHRWEDNIRMDLRERGWYVRTGYTTQVLFLTVGLKLLERLEAYRNIQSIRKRSLAHNV